MPTLIRTSDVPSAHRHDAWRSIVCETLGPLEMRIDPDTPLRGEIDAGSLGPVSVGRVKTSTPHSVHRTPGLIRRGHPELYRVALELDSYLAASAARLSTVVMNLVTAAIAEHADQGGLLPVSSREQTLLLRTQAFIEQHLGDVELAPGTVAAEHHISVRYLYRLFDTQSTTVAAWIRHRRLERCRQDLVDPALRAVPVSAVAARWGLADSAHFSRLFRRTYGRPPAEYRKDCLAAVRPGRESQPAGSRIQHHGGVSPAD
jgi:AraC-like DNA-binding protein